MLFAHASGADSRAAPRGSRRRQWRRGCTVVERARRSRCGGQRRREVVVEGGIGGHGSRLRGRSTSLTAAVSRRLSPSSSVMPSVLRGCVRAPPRAPRAGRGVRPPAAGADAVRGPRFGVRFTGAGAGPVQSRRESRQPARRPLPPARPRRRGRCLTASRGGPAALRIGLRRCGRWLAGGGRTAGRNSRQPPWLTTPAAGKLLDEVLSRPCDEVTGFGRPSTSRPRRVRGTKTASDGCGLGGAAVDLRVDPAAPAAEHDRPATTCSSGDSHAPRLACGPRYLTTRVVPAMIPGAGFPGSPSSPWRKSSA